MFQFVQGDLFESGCDALVNPINCTPAMGKGLALEFRRRFPGLYGQHVKLANAGFIQPGQLTVFQGEGPIIIGLPTKRHWRDHSRLQDVALGVRAVRRLLEANPAVRSVAIPALGCGLGGLKWGDVKAVLLRELEGVSARIVIFPPAGSN